MVAMSPQKWFWWWGSNNQADLSDLIFILIVATVSIFWLLSILNSKNARSHPPLPPGPRGLPLVGNLLSLDHPQLHSQFASLAKTYGPIFTLWFGRKPIIVISSSALAREVLKVHDTIFANRDVTDAGKEISFGGNAVVWLPYGDQWRMLKKICVRQMLSNESLDSVYALRRKEIRNTIKQLYEKVGSPVNIGDQMFQTFMNVVTGMMWGGVIKGEDDVILGTEFRDVSNEITALLTKPNLSDFYPGLAWLDLQGIRKSVKVVRTKFEGIFDRIIDLRKKMASETENKDFLGFLLKILEDGDSKTPFTMTHIKTLLIDMSVAGTDTTTTTIEFALSYLMSKPEILKKAQQELDTVVGENNIVEESHIVNLPYLSAIMKEVLRLHPILPFLLPRSPSESCVIGGYTIPKGAAIFVNVLAIHRDPNIWEKPLEFIPERFLDNKLDFSGTNFSYFPFGSGRRICAGTTMAERMFMYSFASLVHSFDWKPREGETIEVSEKFGTVLRKKEPLMPIPMPRLSTSLYQ